MFTIAGGPGRPADLPGGFPAAVVLIHIFSAADPANPETIAGRWLDRGAFVYYGSVYEPFLLAFRTPRLVAELVAAEVPLVAALRQGEFELLGRPWRLVYLGDPLYRLPVIADTLRADDEGPRLGRLGPSGAPPDPGRSQGWTAATSGSRSSQPERLAAGDWQRIAPEYADWSVVEIAPTPSPAPTASDDGLLAWSHDAAILQLIVNPLPDGRWTRRALESPVSSPADPRRVERLSIFRRIRRDRLDPRHRPIFDDLLIDALSESGAFEELQSRLARILAEECRPRVWEALEAGAMARLARLAGDPDTAWSFAQALDLWDSVIRLAWPARSEFPAQFTERVAAMVQADPSQHLRPWRDRLCHAFDELASCPKPFPHAAVVAAERTRVEAQFDRKP
jgi:hypothetical protein